MNWLRVWQVFEWSIWPPFERMESFVRAKEAVYEFVPLPHRRYDGELGECKERYRRSHELITRHKAHGSRLSGIGGFAILAVIAAVREDLLDAVPITMLILLQMAAGMGTWAKFCGSPYEPINVGDEIDRRRVRGDDPRDEQLEKGLQAKSYEAATTGNKNVAQWKLSRLRLGYLLVTASVIVLIISIVTSH